MKTASTESNISLIIKAFVIFFLALIITTQIFAASPDPIEKLSASIIGDNVRIEWTDQFNASYFVVELATKTDKKGELLFEPIAEIDADRKYKYIYTDNQENKDGLRYYRVKYVLGKGGFEYSDIKTVNFLYKDNYTLNLHPDQYFKSMLLQVNSKSAGTAEVKISCLEDQKDLYYKLNVTDGFNEFPIDLQSLNATTRILVSFTYNDETQHVMLTKPFIDEFIVSE